MLKRRDKAVTNHLMLYQVAYLSRFGKPKYLFGLDYPDTLTSIKNLAFTFEAVGKVKQAISLMQDCCRLQDETLGSHQPHTISSQAALTAWQLDAIILASRALRSESRTRLQ